MSVTPEYSSAVPAQTDEVISLRALASEVWRRKWSVAVLVVVCVAGAVAHSFLATPMYRAEVLVAPTSEGGGDSGLAALAGQFGGLAGSFGLDIGNDAAKVHEATAILTSRDFTIDFLDANNIAPLLFANDWDSATNAWLPDAEPTSNELYKVFDRRVRRISESTRTGHITVSVEWTDPALAAKWANALVTTLNEKMRQRAIAEAEQSIEFLTEELQQTNLLPIRDGIYQLMESQINRIMLANVRAEYAFKIIDPAFAPDDDDPVSPNLPLALVIAVALGVFAGLALVILRLMFSGGARRQSARPTV